MYSMFKPLVYELFDVHFCLSDKNSKANASDTSTSYQSLNHIEMVRESGSVSSQQTHALLIIS